VNEMVVRRRRKKHKLRGHRTFGAGDTKNRRGAGCRGGRGRGGSKKHKFTKYWKTFGVKKTLKPKKRIVTFNLSEIEERIPKWETDKKVVQEKGIYILDGKELGFGKVLGRGEISVKINLKNADVSKKARELILAAGGKVDLEELEKEEKAEESDK